MTRPTCKTCRYWKHRLDDQGPCRRRAPIPAIVDIGGLNIAGREWPETGSDEWCGEHKPIKTETTSVLTNNGVEHLTDKEITAMAEGLQEPDQAYTAYHEEPQT